MFDNREGSFHCDPFSAARSTSKRKANSREGGSFELNLFLEVAVL